MFVGAPLVNVDFVDGVAFNLKVGARLGPAFLMMSLDGLKNLSEDRFTRESVTVGPSVLYTVWQGFAVEGRFAADIYAHNQTQGLAFGLGVSYRRPAE